MIRFPSDDWTGESEIWLVWMSAFATPAFSIASITLVISAPLAPSAAAAVALSV